MLESDPVLPAHGRIVSVSVDRALFFRLATSERFERTVKTAPGGEAAAWRAASRYVAGRSRREALDTAARLLEEGHGVGVDLFGELVPDPASADRVLEHYLQLAGVLPPPPADVWLSVDLSHLALDADPSAVADRLAAIAGVLPAGRRVQVGAEDAARADAILMCVGEVAGRGLADRLGATVQANLLRAPADADMLIGNDDLNWPHCDGLNWPHLRPTGGRLFEAHRARAGGARGNGIQGGAVRADQTGP